MLRKLIISESEKKQISSLYNLLSEGNGFATLKGKTLTAKGVAVPNSKVSLQQNDKIIKGVISDDKGMYTINEIPLGEYKIVLSNKNEGFEDVDDIIKFENAGVYTRNMTFMGLKTTREIVITQKKTREKACLIDVKVVDELGEPIGNAKINIYNSENKKLESSKTDSNGEVKNLLLKYKNEFEPTKPVTADEVYRKGEEKKKIFISCEFDNKESQKYPFDISIWNAYVYEKTKDSPKTYRRDEELLESNKLQVSLSTSFQYSLKSIDSENKEILKTPSIILYSDAERKNIINQGTGQISGNINFDRKEKRFENYIEVYYKIENKGYDTEIGKWKIKSKGENNLQVSLDKEYLNFKVTITNIVDKETGENVAPGGKIIISSDRNNSNVIKEFEIELPINTKIPKIKNKNQNLENNRIVFITLTKEGYITTTKRVRLVGGENKNNFSFEISKTKVPKVKEPKPVKPISELACLNLTNKHYRNMNNVDAGNVTVEELGGVDKIKEDALEVKNCFLKFRNSYPDREKKIINRLLYVQADLDFFGIKLTNKEVRYIYGESKTMSLKHTIRQVISESVKIKNKLTEKNLVEQRLRFSLNGSSGLSESKKRLRNERYNLINFGYNKELVRESFLEVMKGLYGNEGTDVLTDIKTRLGQKIADQVKNKQEEHEMILSAFNDLPTEMIERAIKENRVDELSNEIATKALENYKTQFGNEGLSGIMIASVDENKFKQEVSKLIEPAIKDITTKMDEKLKQVQNAVSGGVNPTA